MTAPLTLIQMQIQRGLEIVLLPLVPDRSPRVECDAIFPAACYGFIRCFCVNKHDTFDLFSMRALAHCTLMGTGTSCFGW